MKYEPKNSHMLFKQSWVPDVTHRHP